MVSDQKLGTFLLNIFNKVGKLEMLVINFVLQIWYSNRKIRFQEWTSFSAWKIVSEQWTLKMPNFCWFVILSVFKICWFLCKKLLILDTVAGNSVTPWTLLLNIYVLKPDLFFTIAVQQKFFIQSELSFDLDIKLLDLFVAVCITIKRFHLVQSVKK